MISRDVVANMKCFLIFLFFLALYKKVALGKTTPTIVPVSLTSCEGTEKFVNLEYKSKGKDVAKAWSGSINLPVTIDANTDFVWEMRWWKDGAWEKNAKIFKGKCCFYLEKFAGRAWREARAAAKPPIDACPIKPGTYNFDNFETDYSDIHLPMMKKGRWSGKITIKKDGKTMCGFLIVDMI